MSLRVALLGTLLLAVGCHRLLPTNEAPTDAPPVTLTSTALRAERRLYDGAPPVIPHKPLNIRCTQCHTSSGKFVPPLGFAPANPHALTNGIGQCQQCHVFKQADDLFRDQENDFAGLTQRITPSDRLYPGAPPVIPHRIFMRESCTSCHSGPTARPEIICKHIERTNCRQCHVPAVATGEQAAVIGSQL